MKKNMFKKITRLICVALVFILSLLLLTSCTGRRLEPSKKATEIVGKVGDHDVPYEELYFLAHNYKADGMSEDELWSLVKENIIANYAILELCDESGVEYSEDELNEDVDTYIEGIIKSDFGSRSKYIDSLKENGSTDSYMRFVTKVDLLYAELEMALAAKGEFITDESQITKYIKDNFVRTHHVMIANNEGDDVYANLAAAKSALTELEAGLTTVYKLIGSKLNEDLIPAQNGYTFARGSMEKAYEDAAFELEVGEHSDIVYAKGELANGEYVDCYYIIERLPLDDEFISAHFSELYETYVDTVIAQKLVEIKSSLEFIQTGSVDIMSLEYPGVGTDVTMIVVITVSSICAIGITAAIILTVRHIRKKRAMAEQKALEKARARISLTDRKGEDK